MSHAKLFCVSSVQELHSPVQESKSEPAPLWGLREQRSRTEKESDSLPARNTGTVASVLCVGQHTGESAAPGLIQHL